MRGEGTIMRETNILETVWKDFFALFKSPTYSRNFDVRMFPSLRVIEAISFYRKSLYKCGILLSTFCLEAKGGAKNSRTTQSLRVFFRPRTEAIVITVCNILTSFIACRAIAKILQALYSAIVSYSKVCL